MAITFYCGSGSPYAWKVWLVLEHKKKRIEALPYLGRTDPPHWKTT